MGFVARKSFMPSKSECRDPRVDREEGTETDPGLDQLGQGTTGSGAKRGVGGTLSEAGSAAVVSGPLLCGLIMAVVWRWERSMGATGEQFLSQIPVLGQECIT